MSFKIIGTNTQNMSSIKQIKYPKLPTLYDDVRQILFKNRVSGTGLTTLSATSKVLSTLPSRVQNGTNFSQRIGRTIRQWFLSVQVQAWHTNDNADVTNGSLQSCSMTFWLVLDRQPNGVAPVPADIFTQGLGDTAQLVYAAMDRFTILKSWMVPIAIAGTPSFSYGTGMSCFQDVVDLHGLKTTYSDVTDDMAALSSNAIYMVVGSSVYTVATPGTQKFQIRYNLTFTD